MRGGNTHVQQVLQALALGAGIVICFQSKYGSRRLMRNVIREYKKGNPPLELPDDVLSQKLYYLRGRGFVTYKKRGDTVRIVLTEAGKKKSYEGNLAKMRIQKPSSWDGMWRLVFADIPEKQRQGRNSLRRKLIQLGFLQMNKSVWIHPYPCEKEIDFVATYFNLERYVHFATVASISNHSLLVQEFKLS